MELYHLHLKNYKRDKWQVGKELIINDNFNNRLYDKVYNHNVGVETKKYDKLAKELNDKLKLSGYQETGKTTTISSLIDVCLYLSSINIEEIGYNDKNTLLKLLKDSRNIIHSSSLFNRELALENYRLVNNKELPSRLHSIFLTGEEAIDYWTHMLKDDDLELYRIEIDSNNGNLFLSNQDYLPGVEESYGYSYNNAFRYWNPNLKKDDKLSREYLYQGKIKILSKEAEFRKSEF